MPSRSPTADSGTRRVNLLQAVHAGRYSPHSGTARLPDASSTSARPDDRPTHPADAAQSRLFQALLLDELDELDDLVAATERRWRRRHDEDPDDPAGTSQALLQLRERAKEANRLLDALRKRFPPD